MRVFLAALVALAILTAAAGTLLQRPEVAAAIAPTPPSVRLDHR